MTEGTRIRTAGVAALFATALALLPGTGVSAQDAGWTIPDGAKDEKSPLKSSSDAAKKGKGLFSGNCQKCHGPLGKGDGPDANGAAADLTVLSTDLNPEGVIYYKVWNGHPPNMPAFKSKLTKDDIWALVAYVQSLRTP